MRDGTLRRTRQRSFTPASFLEEDFTEFPDELDTSFFARVGVEPQGRGREGVELLVAPAAAHSWAFPPLPRKGSCRKSPPHIPMKFLSPPLKQP